MARIRDLKPSFFRNEQLAELPHWTRLLFQGLWGLADRDGRLEDRPKRIGADVFPYEQLPIEEGLDALATAGFILRYVVAGTKLIQVINFAKHQKPHPKEATNSFPSPDQADTAKPEKVTTKPGNSTAGSVGSLALGPLGNGAVGNEKEQARAPRSAELPLPPTWVDAEAWLGFVEMRRKKFPLTPRAANLILKELASLRDAGHDPNECLDRSTRNNWRDVFAPRDSLPRAGPGAQPSARRETLDAFDELIARHESSDLVPDSDCEGLAQLVHDCP